MGTSLAVATGGGMFSATGQRAALVLLAVATWLGCFAVLVRWGTWIPFAVAGLPLSVLAVRLDASLRELLRPSVRKAAVGGLVGTGMVLLTHAGYRGLTALWPQLGAATVQLYELLHVGGFSAVARVALVVVIATCEEIAFRGPLVHPLGWASWRGVFQVTVLAVVYALGTLSLGSGLLVVCAFACGLAWGALCLATRSLVAPIAAHLVWDLGVLFVWPLVPASP